MEGQVTRVGDWLQTFSGVAFWPLDPRPEEVRLEDIAHALARINRFGGHARESYSVAQHSVIVSRLVPPEHALCGLLHDAAETYVGDMVRPLKRSLPDFSFAEKKVLLAIFEHFDIAPVIPDCVHAADEIALATEARDLMGGQSAGKWCLRAEPLPDPIRAWPAGIAEAMFLARFEELDLARRHSEVTRG